MIQYNNMPPIKLEDVIMNRKDFKEAFHRVIGMVRLALEQFDAKVTKRLGELKDGKDGRDGRNGVDGKRGEMGEKGERGESIVGLVGANGTDGKDGSPDLGEDIVVKINRLPTNHDIFKIDAKHIRGL